jgi:hypothetical protein
MTNKSDLSHQSDIIQQQPPQVKKNSSHVWKVIFILFIVVNLLLGGFAGIMIIISALPFQNNYGYGGPGIVAATFAGYFLLILAPIDLIIILFHVRPRGNLRILIYAVLIAFVIFIVVALILYFVLVSTSRA